MGDSAIFIHQFNRKKWTEKKQKTNKTKKKKKKKKAKASKLMKRYSYAFVKI